jgi:hypothetical protein
MIVNIERSEDRSRRGGGGCNTRVRSGGSGDLSHRGPRNIEVSSGLFNCNTECYYHILMSLDQTMEEICDGALFPFIAGG